LALPEGATIPVIDYSNLEQQVQNEYQNLTQYCPRYQTRWKARSNWNNRSRSSVTT